GGAGAEDSARTTTTPNASTSRARVPVSCRDSVPSIPNLRHRTFDSITHPQSRIPDTPTAVKRRAGESWDRQPSILDARGAARVISVQRLGRRDRGQFETCQDIVTQRLYLLLVGPPDARGQPGL